MLTTVTSGSLLQGLRDPANRTVWQSYVDRYRPVLIAFGRRRGLCRDDAEDLAQVVLLEFSTAYRNGRYDPAKGRLRAWLFGIARNQLLVRLRRGRADAEGLGPIADGGAEQAPAPEGEGPEEAWSQEWRAAVLRQCLEEVRQEIQPRTWRAFERFALQGRPAEAVAAELEMTANAVFLAKRRVLRRARELLPVMEEIW